MTPFARDIRMVPNILSLARVLMVFITLIVILFFNQLEIGLLLGFLAGFSDFLDGYYARKLNQTSELGVVLDQYSDLVYEGLFFLLLTTYGAGLHPAFLGAYLTREFWVMSMRRMMAERGIETRSSIIGKVKTHFYSYGFILYWCYLGELIPSLNQYFYWGGIGLFVGGVILSYWSGVLYTLDFINGYNRIEGAKERQGSV